MFSLVRITMLVPEGSTSGAVVRTCSGVVATRWEFCELLCELLCANDIAQQSATARANKLIRFMLPLLIQTIECRIQRLDAENRRAGKLVRRSNSEESYCGMKPNEKRRGRGGRRGIYFNFNLIVFATYYFSTRELLRAIVRAALQRGTIVVVAALIVAIVAAVAGAPQCRTIVIALVVELVAILDFCQAGLDVVELGGVEDVLGAGRQNV